MAVEKEWGETGLKMCCLLLWTEQQYADHIYITGLNYLQVYLKGFDAIISAMEKSPAYWAWFRGLRAELDRCMLEEEHFSQLSRKARLELYLRVHNPQVMCKDFRPNRVVMDSIKKVKHLA